MLDSQTFLHKMALQGKRKPLGAEELWEYALRCLDRRQYSAGELQLKLRQRAESAAALRAVADKLREYGLTDDQKFAESFATARLESKGFGARRVLQDLRARQIPASTAERIVRQVYGAVDESTLIRQYLERKFRGKDLGAHLSEPKNLSSVYRRLRTAGFSANGSIAVLRGFSRQADELSEPDLEQDSDEQAPESNV